MAIKEWYQAIKLIEDHIVQVSTPYGWGTGFLVSRTTLKEGKVCAIATAAHVVKSADDWEQPIRLDHKKTGSTRLLHFENRIIEFGEEKDTAAILFNKDGFPFPETPFRLAPEGNNLNPGIEIGWMGFPAIFSDSPCFFSGRISAYNESKESYLVDGVAINGVSGGPAFWIQSDEIILLGVVSAYMPNYATGETLPGLSIVTNVTKYHEISKRFKSIEESETKKE